ncbi:aldo/keto reductase [Cognatishimia sp. SS12]|uniref:aldo/keto reductase n=1 Tax=Cognatishimia sp. SS12 TaxID=2979465 RepID=UPI00232F9207|nr:aldo/keto reductase [Cognatishimia sp. SS12]MDC0738742.1 aldo/keto reductase [Cognatishimia sp. SS12]
MKHRPIGTEKRMVSAVGVGAMSFADFYGPTTEENSLAILDAARDAGVTHIDTANVYGMGRSETVIGQYLAARGAAERERLHIATKAAIMRNADGGRRFNNEIAYLETELDASLKRLGTDHVDLFYVHRRDQSIPIEEVAGALGDLVKKGKTRGIGFSEIAPTSLMKAHAVHPVDAVQSEYSLATRAPELGLLQACERTGTTFVAFSPVGRSFLTDAPLSADAVANGPFLRVNPRMQEPNYSANLAAAQPFRALAADMGYAAASLAIAWVLARGQHIIAIPGTRSVAHFEELVKGAEIDLSAADLEAIETVLPVGWAHGDRYNAAQWEGPERYC